MGFPCMSDTSSAVKRLSRRRRLINGISQGHFFKCLKLRKDEKANTVDMLHNQAGTQETKYQCSHCIQKFQVKLSLFEHLSAEHGFDVDAAVNEAGLKLPKTDKIRPTDVTPKSLATSTDSPLNQEEGATSDASTGTDKISVYKCPKCRYVNTRTHGVLTHCQMKHPDFSTGAEELPTGEVLLSDMVRCTLGKGFNERGYVCHKCPQIHPSLKRLKIHCEKVHGQLSAETDENESETHSFCEDDNSQDATFLLNPAAAPETQYQCSHCIQKFKFKLSLFEHLSTEHGFDVDAAVRDAGLRLPKTDKPKSTDITPESLGAGQDLKTSVSDNSSKEEKQCHQTENLKGSPTPPANPETQIMVLSENPQNKMNVPSNSKESHKLSKNLKSYKKPLQTITKYFTVSSGSNGNPPVPSTDSPVPPDSTKGTLILQESLSSSVQNNGVFKVTAKSQIDVAKVNPAQLLQSDLFFADRTTEQCQKLFKGKRTSSEICESPPSKKIKTDRDKTKLLGKAKANKRESSSVTEFSFEVSEDDEKTKNNATEGPTTYSCKHCDYSDGDVRQVSTHYHKDHPYIRFDDRYIQDPDDESATFRCLVCPVEFSRLADLTRHHEENHADTPDIFTLQLSELRLDFKCFMCPFTSKVSSALKEHYREKHPAHKVNSTLMYCRYLLTGCQEGPLKGTTCEKTLERSEELRNAASVQDPISKAGANVSLYQCHKCPFSHKSVIVMHVHYQKSHPEESVTIDTIKQSAALQSCTPEKMPAVPASVTTIDRSTPEKKIEDKVKTSQRISLFFKDPKHSPEASESHSMSPKTKKSECAEDRRERSTVEQNCETSDETDTPFPSVTEFYCQFCSFSSTNVKSVVSHCNMKHAKTGMGIEDIVKYSSKLQNKNPPSEAEASPSETSPFSKCEDSKSSKVEESNEKQNAYADAKSLFYCQACNYASTSIRGALHHQIIHPGLNPSKKLILEYTAMIRDQIVNSKSQPERLANSTDLPLPILNEGDEEMFFCHFCNYRHDVVGMVVKHYYKQHRGFEFNTKQVSIYTMMVLEQIQALSQKTAKDVTVGYKGNERKAAKNPGTLSSASAKEEQKHPQTLRCHICTYSTQNKSHMRRHVLNIHKAQPSDTDDGNVLPGYKCDVCSFSHRNADVMYKHFRRRHPGRKLSLELLKLKCRGVGNGDDGTDESLQSQWSGQNEAKRYSCRACSFKCTTVSEITDHYRAVHPWSVKEDGSVPDVNSRKKPSANKHREDSACNLGSCDTYQAPVEFEKLSDDVAASSTVTLCPHCPAGFVTEQDLKAHLEMKHLNSAAEQEGDIQVFKCPYCTYMNENYQGVLTHCQMKHPSCAAKADSLNVNAQHLQHWKRSQSWNAQKFRGYMCQTCPQICVTMKMLSMHCEKYHNETLSNSPKALATKKILLRAQKTQYKKKYTLIKCQQCSYSCSTTTALVQHLRLKHRQRSRSRDSPYKCGLCSQSYFIKKHLELHYLKKHGNQAFLKSVELEQRPDSPLDLEAGGTSDSSARIDRISVYKCPQCRYVNTRTHGVLTHCQMKHPDFIARAEELPTGEILLSDMVSCTLGKGFNERGYVCHKCPQIHPSLMRLKIHCEKVHGQLFAETDDNESLFEDDDSQDAQARSNISRRKFQTAVNRDGVHRCTLCSFSALSRNQLVAHYTKKHLTGMHQQNHKRAQPPSADLAPENTTKDLSGPNTDSPYKCDICSYVGACRKYLSCHYKNAHKYDSFTTWKMLQKYNKRRNSRFLTMVANSERVVCIKCPDLFFTSSQDLIAHYSSFHSCLDFIVLYPRSARQTGVYKCGHCMKQLNGIKILCCHLDRHTERNKKEAAARNTEPSLDTATTPNVESMEVCEQTEPPALEAAEALVESSGNLEEFSDQEPPELDSGKTLYTCKLCSRTFRWLKGLRSHERSHMAMAAMKKQNVPPSRVKIQSLNKYVIYKSWTTKPFQCSICLYRTPFQVQMKTHFMKKHRDVIKAPKAEDQDEVGSQGSKEEPLKSPSTCINFNGSDEEPEINEKLLYSEPPDVQRQLNHISSIAHTGALSKAVMPETKTSGDSLLHCERCNFTTEHLFRMRRHYMSRHGKKIIRCKDCNFFTGFRKCLDMHVETVHSTFQSEPPDQKDFRCPFCLYQTKNKNSMIDHIILHREERVVPIEVRRPKLSRYLRGIVFRCHKCTFTSASAENLHLHMRKHEDIKPYKCRLCFFDCTRLCDLERHLCDKHQIVRNHALVCQVTLDQLDSMSVRVPEEDEEPSFPRDSVDVEMEEAAEVPRVRLSFSNDDWSQMRGMDGSKDNKGSDAKTFDLEPMSRNAPVHETPEQQEQRAFLTDNEGGNESDVQSEDCGVSEEEKPNDANDLSDSAGSRITVKEEMEEVAEMSERIHKYRPEISLLEVKVEDEILQNILKLDTSAIHRVPRTAVQDPGVNVNHVEIDIRTQDKGCGTKRTESLDVLKDEPSTVDGTDKEKAFTCDLCGRNLPNSSALERHIVRHGM